MCTYFHYLALSTAIICDIDADTTFNIAGVRVKRKYRKYTQEEAEEMRLLRQDGWTYEDIGECFNAKIDDIYKCLKRFGLFEKGIIGKPKNGGDAIAKTLKPEQARGPILDNRAERLSGKSQGALQR